MSAKIPQPTNELERHFHEQILFLSRSADGYDDGVEIEAKRIATTLRVLLHNTKASHSLLAQLGREGTAFYDSVEPDDDDNILTYAPLVALIQSAHGPKVVPRLDDFVRGSEQRVPFGTWWSATIFRDKRGRSLSRRGLVLAVANQDGGAHVDPGLDETYHGMSREASLDVLAARGDADPAVFEGTEFASLRQIAHEVFKSFDGTYTKRRAARTGESVPILMPRLSLPGMGTFQRARVDAAARGVKFEMPGRNDPCPCKSGQKWKKCHGASL